MEPVPRVGFVIVTTAKGMRYLPKLLMSVSRQTYTDHETTIVVDGADAAVLEYLSSAWPGLHVISIDPAGGYIPAVDRGTRESRGEYIGMLDDDIELEPDWLALLVAELEHDPKIGFATGKTLLYEQRDVLNEANQDLHTCGRFVPRGLLERDVGQYDTPGPTTVASGSASVYRRQAVEDAGGFDVDYGGYGCDESDLCLRMLLSGYRGRYIPGARAYHGWSSTIGRDSERSVFLSNRNALTTMFKDVPAPLLLRSLPKIVRYQWHVYKVARAAHWSRTLVRAWLSFLRLLPATLRKRRSIQRRRAIGSSEFETFLLSDYPELPEVVRDPDDMLRFGPARLRLIARDLAGRNPRR